MIFRFQKQAEGDQGMKVVGMPKTFWVVVRPTPNSEIGDFCFECDFRQFALQVRGGLDVDNVVGIYADQEVATATATKLIEAVGNQSDTDTVTHPSPWPEWFATQHDHRSVLLCDNASEEKIKVEPPASWGNAWAWNVTKDGTGIVMRRSL